MKNIKNDNKYKFQKLVVFILSLKDNMRDIFLRML